MQTIITDLIDNDHRSHYWYGGQCAKIEHNGYIASIEACGDVYAEYYKGEECLIYVRDKSNSGRFYDEMRYYINNDKELYEAINVVSPRGDSLLIDYNNWWECFIIDPQGNFHDLMWALDSDYLDDAIKEVEENLEDIIKQIEEDK
jgi:hypothetical protein